jgi:hypothetical protein
LDGPSQLNWPSIDDQLLDPDRWRDGVERLVIRRLHDHATLGSEVQDTV